MDAWMDEWMKVSSKVGTCQYRARAGDLGANLDRPRGFVVSLCSLQMSNWVIFYTSFEAELLLHDVVLQISDAYLRIICIEHVLRL